MFYYIDVHLLAHYIQWIKMDGETVKYVENKLWKTRRQLESTVKVSVRRTGFEGDEWNGLRILLNPFVVPDNF
jgi:hypothetical protein